MTNLHSSTPQNSQEHSVPIFWPFAAAIELGEAGLRQFQDNLAFLKIEEKITEPSEWATLNRIVLEVDTMRLRDFSPPHVSPVQRYPVLIDAPHAGQSSTIADFAPGKSLVQSLQTNGLQQVFVTDWKNADLSMKDFDIDKYLADINLVVDHLGGRVDYVGLCQGGWMGAMYAARFPNKVNSLVLAGSPIDTQAGDGPLKKIVHQFPYRFYENLVEIGGGLMRGQTMLSGWKGMNPEQQYFGKYLDLYQHIEDKNYIERTERFERWYENAIDLPGAYYLQTIQLLFKENQLAKGEFVGLGEVLSLRNIVCPVYLLAGQNDEMTPKEQVFAAEQLLGTPKNQIVKAVVPGGHLGLFMGSKAVAEYWPVIARWIMDVHANQKTR